jgi:hypothetical protein
MHDPFPFGFVYETPDYDSFAFGGIDWCETFTPDADELRWQEMTREEKLRKGPSLTFKKRKKNNEEIKQQKEDTCNKFVKWNSQLPQVLQVPQAAKRWAKKQRRSPGFGSTILVALIFLDRNSQRLSI